MILFLPVSGCMCSSAPARTPAPAFNAKAIGSAAVAAYDKNGDGKIELSEMSSSLKSAVKDKSGDLPHDSDGDKALNASEIAARIESIEKSRIGRMSIACEVKLDGKPVNAATVTFQPEPFLGGVVQAASGTTDSSGVAIIKGDVDGVQPGFYSIQISKKDASGKETLPARYNTETEFGREIAQGLDSLRGSLITLSLTSDKPPSKK